MKPAYNALAITRTIGEYLRKEGRKEGRIKGRIEGIRIGRMSLLIKVLRRQFKDLTTKEETLIAKLSLDQLDELFDISSDISSVSQLEKWLNTNIQKSAIKLA